MRDDLLEAKACVDWTVSKLKAFRADTETWLADNVYVAIENSPLPATHDFVVVEQRETFPLFFQVEFGAYLNTLRSSLDIVASALGARHNISNPDDIYFPIAKSEQLFIDRKCKGKELINGLPQTERTLLESLKPYQGGNDCLWILHQLDIKRKHRRLLSVAMRPIAFSAPSDFPSDAFIPDFDGWLVPADHKATLGRIKKNILRTADDLKVTLYIAIHEPALVRNLPAVEALHDFARFADAVITLFDI